MASLASINIKFSADLAQFSKQMENVNRSLKRTGQNLQRVGAGLTASLTLPLVGLGGIAIKTAADLETLKTSLDTVFDGNKELSTKAFDDIKEFSSTTPFQLEEVAQAFIKLKNLGLDPSMDSLTSYGNTASALGKTLDQMIEAVADASVGEFERLKEFGIKARSEGDNVAFTFQGVTTTVKKNSEEIQQYLLGIGNTQFAGSIERQANTFNGKISTLKDNLSQAFASIGEILIDYINPLFDKINGVLKQFQELSPTTKKWIVILGGIAAAIGPLLALAGTILPAIGTGLALLTGPIGLIVAGLTAVGVVIYKNWKPIKQTLIDIANYFIDLYNESTVFRIGVEAVALAFKTLFEVGKFVFETLKNIVGSFIENFTNGFKVLGKIIKAVLTGNLKELPAIIKDGVEQGKQVFGGFTDELANDWKALTDNLEKDTNTALDNIKTRRKIEFLKPDVEVQGVEDAVAEATKKGVVKGLTENASGGGGRRQQTALLDTSGLQQEGLTELQSPLTPIAEMLPEEVSIISEQYVRALELAGEFNEGLTEIMESGAESFAEGFGSFLGNFAAGQAGIGDLAALFLNTIANMAIQLGKMAISIGIAVAGIKKALQSLNPAVAIAAGIALVALGTLVKSAAASIGEGGSAPAFANGGIVGGTSFYGDKILARVNSGELILNSKQQKRVYDAMSKPTEQPIVIDGDFKLTGDTVQLMLDRAAKKKSRRT